jgi:hypothetical protein
VSNIVHPILTNLGPDLAPILSLTLAALRSNSDLVSVNVFPSIKPLDTYLLAATSFSNFATVLFNQLKTMAWSLCGSSSALSDSQL